jgi:hypothetical protein
VWEPDIPLVGAMEGDRKVSGPPGGGYSAYNCFDLERHPSESVPTDAAWCKPMFERLNRELAAAANAQ